MAKVTVSKKTTKKMVTVEKNVETKTFLLELSEEEAMTLLIIWSRVGGSPTKSIRRYMDDICYAIRKHGIDYPPNHLDYFTTTESLWLKDKVKLPSELRE